MYVYSSSTRRPIRLEQQLMATLAEVVDGLVAATGDLALMARFSVVDANEVVAALIDVEADSAEGVALRLLAKYNPANQIIEIASGDAP